MNLIPLVDENRLVTLINDESTTRLAWGDRAACRDLPDGLEAYYPDDGEVPALAAIVCCLRCPVSEECLAAAMIHEERDGYRNGWWGGLGPEERDDIAHRLRATNPLAETTVPSTDTHTPTDGEGTNQPADHARYLRSLDHTIPFIAGELGCTERTVYRYLAKPAT
ncbi:MAG: WhiB family transcriptional regulator [Acidimicrobiia bacterium]|nr:WhiB family transcriptional regulator [Acidimicrobiia bacterium]MYB75247.1 WhiB family transcriptional regulator [Acidimicrobiia bacterium]MYI00737.1 WhiB family transcriptional regulator [Acidimicrobiia bacterium]